MIGLKNAVWFKQGVRLTSKQITLTILNHNKYAVFMINADKNADSMFNTENF